MAYLYLNVNGKTYEFRGTREGVEECGRLLHAENPRIYGGQDTRGR